MPIPDTTAVLLSAKRPANMPPIVDRVTELPWVAELLVWHNPTPECRELVVDRAANGKPVRVWNTSQNVYTLGRYQAAATMAACDWIAVQDDDCLVKPETWAQLYAARAPGRIVTAVPPSPFSGDARRHWGTAHEVFLGWGAIFHRDLARRFLERIPTSFCTLSAESVLWMRKADRLFSILANTQHTVICAQHESLPLESEHGVALYREPDHMRLTIEARRLALTMLGIPFQDIDISWP